MSTKKAKVPVKSKKNAAADGLHKPSKMKPLKGKKKSWDDDEDAEPEIMDDDLKGFDSFADDDDDDDY